MLKSAVRVVEGRCAPPAETAARLETALRERYDFEVREERVGDALYRGTFQTDALGFTPMGKGATPLLCRISTLAEAAEWLALKRRRELPGYQQGHERDIPAPLPIASLLSHIATVTPQMLERIRSLDAARHWVTGTSLIRNGPVQVPLEYVHAISGTNGLAAGNCLEEAVVAALHEVFERRAAITLIKNRMTAPTFDPASVEDATARAQLAAVREQGIEVTIKDLSFGGALPCVGVYFRDPGIPAELQCRHLLKAAAAWDRAAALRSCLTEYAQIARPGQKDEESPPDHQRLLAGDDADNFLPLFWFGYVPFRDAAFLAEGDVVPFEPGEEPGDCLEDIERAKGICGQLDKDCVVVDLTDPGVGFPVVQVVIPGYSDILPYHPPSSPVLFTGWTRTLSMGRCRNPDGPPTSCTAQNLFPDW